MSGSQWPGLVTNASPFAIPPTAAVEQVNLVGHVPGQVSVRGGMRKVATTSGSPELLDCFPLEVDGKPALVGMRADGSLSLLSSPSYGWASSIPYEPDLSSPALLTASYTYRYIGAGADDLHSPGPDYDPGTDTSGCSSTIDGGPSVTPAWEFYLDAQSCEAVVADYLFDGGGARSVPDCESVVTANLCDSGDEDDGGTIPPAPGLSVPTAPRNVRAEFGASSATLTWDAPANDGGTVVIDYQHEVSTDGGGSPDPLPFQFDPPVVLSWGQTSAFVAVYGPHQTPPSGWTVELETQSSTDGGTTWTGV